MNRKVKWKFMLYKRTIGIKKRYAIKKDTKLVSECEGIVLT